MHTEREEEKRIRQYIETRTKEATTNICAVAYDEDRAHYLFMSDLRVMVQHLDALRVMVEHGEAK